MIYNEYEDPVIEIKMPSDFNNNFNNNIFNIIKETGTKKIIISKDVIEWNRKLENFLTEILSITEYVYMDIRFRINYFKFNKKVEYFLNIDFEDILNEKNRIVRNVDMFFLEIDISKEYSEDEWEIVYNYFTKNKDLDMVLNLYYSDVNSVSFERYIVVLEKVRKIKNRVYLTSIFKPTQVIIEHPCNAYLCSDNSCHSNKTNFPRYLYISEKGISPYRSKDTKLLFLKEIGDVSIKSFEKYYLQEYNGSSAHINFLKKNRYIFNEYVSKRIFTIMAWNIFLDKTY